MTNPDRYSEDGTFIGPWWFKWAFLALGLGGPIVWLLVFKSITLHELVLWGLFMAMLNLMRAGKGE